MAPTKIIIEEKMLDKEKVLGMAWPHQRRIEIDSRLPSKQYLNTLIHELLHIFNPEWPENKIAETANEMSEVIWSRDYRRIKP